MIDLTELAENDLWHCRLLSTGEWACVQRFIFTTGLLVGVDRVGYRTRFCYGSMTQAVDALNAWDGEGFPPGFWIKQKPEEVHGPGSTDFYGKHYDSV